MIALTGRRRNAGHLRVYAIGFLQDPTEEAFAWFLKDVLEVVGLAPKLITNDQCYAQIIAARAILPQCLLILDDFHLNENQTKNVK